MRIDAEVRFWRRSKTPTQFQDTPLLTQDYLLQHLEPQLMTHGFKGCIAVLETELAALPSVERKTLLAHRHILGVIPPLPEQAELPSAPQAGVLGYHLRSFTGSTHQLKQLDILSRLDLPLELDLAGTSVETVRDLIEKMPNLRIIFNRMGGLGGATDQVKTADDPWPTAIQWLQDHPQTFIKLSGLIKPSDAGHFDDWDLPLDHFKPRLEALLAIFGEDRMLFSSNWPAGLMAASFEDTLDLISALIEMLAPQSLAKIMGLNAALCYRIGN
ncbi:MAG: amidohydrolase family protein [Pseudomonadales bacterium]|jgi:predicted TIM-barrel fold metal-dependent hydrolase